MISSAGIRSAAFSIILLVICLWTIFSSSRSSLQASIIISLATQYHHQIGRWTNRKKYRAGGGSPLGNGIDRPKDDISYGDSSTLGGESNPVKSGEGKSSSSGEKPPFAVGESKGGPLPVSPQDQKETSSKEGDREDGITRFGKPVNWVNPDHLTNRPLIVYVYFESDFARRNLQFFVDHGIHDAADFVFVLNGETNADTEIVFNKAGSPSGRPRGKNIKVKRRENVCLDLGAHHELLNGVDGGEGWFDIDGPIPTPEGWVEPKPEPVSDPAPQPEQSGDDMPDSGSQSQPEKRMEIEKPKPLPLRERYKRFILMNASIRGPFVPSWSRECWSDAYLAKVTSKVKLVGMSYNCHGEAGHIQSMLWATDSVGLNLILSPDAIGTCFPDMRAAIIGEVRTTLVLRQAGYEVDTFLTVFHSQDKEAKAAARRKGSKEPAGPGEYWRNCTTEDWLGPGSYFGSFVHPYENLFMI